jgi:hypothetical protein
MRRLAVLLAVLVGLYGAVGTVSAAITQGIAGTVTVGPITPNCIPGLPCTRPYSTDIRITQGSASWLVHSDASGHYELSLPSGTYSVVGVGTSWPKPGPAVSAVVTDGVVTVDIHYDSGLRIAPRPIITTGTLAPRVRPVVTMPPTDTDG